MLNGDPPQLPFMPDFPVVAADAQHGWEQWLHLWDWAPSHDGFQYVMIATGDRRGSPIAIQTTTRPIIVDDPYVIPELGQTPLSVAYDDAALIAEGILHPRVADMQIAELGLLLPRLGTHRPSDNSERTNLMIDGVPVAFTYARRGNGWAAVARYKDSFVSIASAAAPIDTISLSTVDPTQMARLG